MFETYSGHRAVFHALSLEGLEAMMFCEGPVRAVLTEPFESILKVVLRPQTQLDRIINAVREVAGETGAPPKMLEAAYRAHVLKEGAGENGDLRKQMHRIANEYQKWKQRISGIDASVPKSARIARQPLEIPSGEPLARVLL